MCVCVSFFSNVVSGVSGRLTLFSLPTIRLFHSNCWRRTLPHTSGRICLRPRLAFVFSTSHNCVLQLHIPVQPSHLCLALTICVVISRSLVPFGVGVTFPPLTEFLGRSCLLSHCLSTCGWTALIERVQRDPGTSLLFENEAIHIVVGLR